jgi:GNAT superfamily N-acetyltransferase
MRDGLSGPVHVTIERVRDLPGGALDALIAESERAGLGFVRRLVEDWTAGRNRFDRPGEALFVARRDGRIVGVSGLNVDPFSAGDRVGRVRHLYVLVDCRRQGVGRRLVAEVIAAAREAFDVLRLRTGNPAAALFYEALGFRPAEAGMTDATHHLALADSAGTGRRAGSSAATPSS